MELGDTLCSRKQIYQSKIFLSDQLMEHYKKLFKRSEEKLIVKEHIYISFLVLVYWYWFQ